MRGKSPFDSSSVDAFLDWMYPISRLPYCFVGALMVDVMVMIVVRRRGCRSRRSLPLFSHRFGYLVIQRCVCGFERCIVSFPRSQVLNLHPWLARHWLVKAHPLFANQHESVNNRYGQYGHGLIVLWTVRLNLVRMSYRRHRRRISEFLSASSIRRQG